MRLRSGIRSDVVAALLLALAALLVFVPASRAVPPAEAPADVHVVYSDARLIAVAWSPAADPSLAAQVSWGPPGSSDPPGVATFSPGHEWSLDVRCGQELTIAVAFQNAGGEVGPSTTIEAASDSCDPGPPEPPAAEVSDVQGGSVELAWPDPVANDVAYAEAAVTEPAEFAATTQEGWASGGSVLAGLRCGTAYDLTVTFVDFDGNRSAAATAHATTLACDTLGPAPEAPAKFHVVGTAGRDVTLAWEPSPLPGVVRTVLTVGGPTGARLSIGASSTQATMPVPGCGDQPATVALLYEDGRLSKPATVTVNVRPCPRQPPKTLGPIPTRRASINVHRQDVVKVGRSGDFALPGDTVQCPAAGGSCRVVIRVQARIPGKRGLGPLLTLGETETTLTPRFLRTVTGRLSPRGRAVLRRRGRLRVSVEIEAWHLVGLNAFTAHATFVQPRG